MKFLFGCRYWEGRRLWSNMTQNIRTLTRCIWVGVKESGTAKEIIEKTSVLNLLVAFAVSTKNYLREEYSYDSEDLRELISHIPKFQTPSSVTPLDSQRPAILQVISEPIQNKPSRPSGGGDGGGGGGGGTGGGTGAPPQKPDVLKASVHRSASTRSTRSTRKRSAPVHRPTSIVVGGDGRNSLRRQNSYTCHDFMYVDG